MLTSFTVERFKSYEQEATLHLAPLTVLIIVEALRLLSWIAHGNKLGAISHTVQGDNQAIRGALKDLAFRRKRMSSFRAARRIRSGIGTRFALRALAPTSSASPTSG